MFKGLGNLAGMLKQAQQMGSRLQALNEELRARRVTGTAGGGMVTVEANGIGEVLSCRIDPAIAGDREMIEDLLPAAINQCLAKTKQLHADSMQSMAAGMNLPGLDDIVSQISSEQGDEDDDGKQKG